MKVVKTKSWVVKHEEVVRHVGDYKVTDSYLDGKLIGQEWERIDGKVTHPIEIPYYNQDEGRTHAVVFQYRAPSRKSFVSKLKEALPKKHKDLYLHGM